MWTLGWLCEATIPVVFNSVRLAPRLIALQAAGAGLFFCRWLRSHSPMDPDLENVIRRALGIAKAVGKDDMGQTMIAVQAVQRARPDMTAADALAAVNLVQHK